MKKFLLPLAVLATAGVSAQTLEERVEALEYQSYENFFKWSGSLEYRYDKRDDEAKTAYTTLASDQTTSISTPVGEQGSSRQRIFMNLDMASNPTDKLSFYGRIVMRKFFNEAVRSGTRPEDGTGFSDLIGAGAGTGDTLFVERAFFNYNLFDKFTLTVGRLPTLHGPPKHFSRDETIGGEYTVSIFSGMFDGVAGTYSLNDKNKIKFVYSPFSKIDYNNTNNNESYTNWSLIYQFDGKVSFARNLFVQLAQLYTNKLTFSTVDIDVSKQVLYTEFQGLAGSNFDLAFHVANTKTTSRGSITGVGGWYASAAQVAAATNNEVESDGWVYGLLAKYAILPTTKIGVEYFHGDDEAFLYDAVPLDAINVYATRGDVYRVFVNHKLSSNLNATLGYINQNRKAVYTLYDQLGGKQVIDDTNQNFYLSLVANF